ncbi:MAG TPA: Bax inhibitor-1/YccA family protein [Gemmatimonadaceae bacterium]|nr:Bax inhibitor-1/YccA family protein [Gemmatimonadaceae bacterium]
MDRSNPALRSAAFRDALGHVTGERMTMTGAATKSAILVLLTIFSAGVVWQAMPGRPELVLPATLVGALGGFVVAMIASFRPQTAPITAPLYAVLEGLFLGAISQIYNARYHGLPAQAVALTCLTLLAMLFAYRVGWIRATPNFRRIVVAGTLGFALFYFVAIILSLFHVNMGFMYDSSPLGIILSLLACGLAALNLVLDFDLIEKSAQAGAPKAFEWYAGFSLLVTLVWMYLEILRLLSRSRN